MADDDTALETAVEQVWRRDFLALIQEPITGYDVRLDFANGDFVFGIH